MYFSYTSICSSTSITDGSRYSRHDGVGVTSPEESKKGFPFGCGFDLLIPSLIFIGNLIAFIDCIQSDDRRLE